MKKKKLKELSLKKISISNLNNSHGAAAPDDGSWYYCHSEGLGCMLRSRIFDDCPNPPDKPDPDHTRGCPSYNVAC